VARRAERDAWELDQSGGEVSGDVLLFLNRLSDLLWILARVEEQPDGA
jgi:cob(I)alamin adenosyltransferase